MTISTLENEVMYRPVHSSGAGGQHVNKVATKIQLTFSITTSTALTPNEKEIIRQQLARKITKEGLLIINCSKTRSQLQNKKLSLLILISILKKALQKHPKRVTTAVPKTMIRKRLNDKKLQALKKENRRKKNDS